MQHISGRTRQWQHTASVLLAVVVSACASAPADQQVTPDEDQAVAYRAAVADAAIYRKEREHQLNAVPANADTIRVVTWTSRPESFPLGQPMTVTWGDVWVTLDPEVQVICRRFEPAARVLRLQQLLGLPLPERDRTFVILEARVEALFRPCPNPDPTAPICSRDFPVEVPAEHVAWIARQLLASFQEPGGYPWTRLGYTYNWRPGSGERYGASEYVVRQGSSVLPLAQYATSTYCEPTSQN